MFSPVLEKIARQSQDSKSRSESPFWDSAGRGLAGGAAIAGVSAPIVYQSNKQKLMSGNAAKYMPNMSDVAPGTLEEASGLVGPYAPKGHSFDIMEKIRRGGKEWGDTIQEAVTGDAWTKAKRYGKWGGMAIAGGSLINELMKDPAPKAQSQRQYTPQQIAQIRRAQYMRQMQAQGRY